MKLQLIDTNPDMCSEWKVRFGSLDDVIIHNGDFFSLPTTCVVSPANSFGFMDGGLDLVISRKLGWGVQKSVQRAIRNKPIGELLVGEAVLVPTGDEEIPYCISAPTMRVPMILTDTVNVYLAAKAAFTLANQFDIETLTISGLGTGVGQVPFSICAKQMRQAYDDVFGTYRYPVTWHESQIRHQLMYTKDFRDLQFPD